jgi:tetratricopeptide (TPR) repeat protein
MMSGNYAEAVGYLQQAIALDPYYKGIHQMFGLAYYCLGKYKSAVECLQAEIEAFPDE